MKAPTLFFFSKPGLRQIAFSWLPEGLGYAHWEDYDLDSVMSLSALKPGNQRNVCLCLLQSAYHCSWSGSLPIFHTLGSFQSSISRNCVTWSSLGKKDLLPLFPYDSKCSQMATFGTRTILLFPFLTCNNPTNSHTYILPSKANENQGIKANFCLPTELSN